MRQLKITKSITNRESASLDKYLQEIGREDLITVEEEVELAQAIKKGDRKALEKLTKAKVNAMRKMLNNPVVLEALESMALFHLEGRVISNPPKNDVLKATSIAKKSRLKMAFVERSLSADAPKMEVTMTPSAT